MVRGGGGVVLKSRRFDGDCWQSTATEELALGVEERRAKGEALVVVRVSKSDWRRRSLAREIPVQGNGGARGEFL